jgi:SAM-dependent methyltransferase
MYQNSGCRARIPPEAVPASVPPPTLDRLLRKEADPAFRRRTHTLFEWLGPAEGGRLLEAGCGRGFHLKMLRTLGWDRLAGVDPEVRYLQRAVGSVPHARYPFTWDPLNRTLERGGVASPLRKF